MRIDRFKHAKRTLQFFKITYGIVPPYHVIIDGNFIFQAVRCAVDLRDALAKVLQTTNVHLYVTSAVLEELRALGAPAESALEFALSCDEILPSADAPGAEEGTDAVEAALSPAAIRRQRKRAREAAEAAAAAARGSRAPRAADPTEAMLALVQAPTLARGVITVVSRPTMLARPSVSAHGRQVIAAELPPHRMFATQDPILRARIRQVPGVPLLFLNRNVLVLDAPSDASRAAAAASGDAIAPSASSSSAAASSGRAAPPRVVVVQPSSRPSASSSARAGSPAVARKGPPSMLSDADSDAFNAIMAGKFRPGFAPEAAAAAATAAASSSSDAVTPSSQASPSKRAKKRSRSLSGPNPLSCLPKKPKPAASPAATAVGPSSGAGTAAAAPPPAAGRAAARRKQRAQNRALRTHTNDNDHDDDDV